MQYHYYLGSDQGPFASHMPLTTRRHSFAQFMICASGCCCGRVDKGKPAVPVAWLKQEWRARRLNPRVQLTISECLGPCDLVNVVAVFGTGDPIWLGGMTEEAPFRTLLHWAAESHLAGTLLQVPAELEPYQFTRFLSSPLQQERSS